MVQPGVSAFGKKNSTTGLPRKSLSETFLPFSSGKVKSGALSLIFMWLFAFHSFLYRTARQAVIWAAVLLFALVLALTLANAQYGRPAKVSKGPRALGLLQLAANGKAHLIPITIMVDGKFYDAAAYKASPVPMALQPETVYEALRTGISQGIFTISDARNSNDNGSPTAPGFPRGRLQLNRLTPQRQHRFLAITTPHPCCDVHRRRSRTQRTSPLRTSRLRASRLRASPRRRLRPHRPQSLLEQQPVRRLPPVRFLLPKIKTIPSCAEAFRREPLSRKKWRLLLRTNNRLLLRQRRNLLARRVLFS